jgi:hypothetical protein
MALWDLRRQGLVAFALGRATYRHRCLPIPAFRRVRWVTSAWPASLAARLRLACGQDRVLVSVGPVLPGKPLQACGELGLISHCGLFNLRGLWRREGVGASLYQL